jgi:hypothetical protein
LKVGLRMQNRFEAEVGDEIKLQWIGCWRIQRHK